MNELRKGRKLYGMGNWMNNPFSEIDAEGVFIVRAVSDRIMR